MKKRSTLLWVVAFTLISSTSHAQWAKLKELLPKKDKIVEIGLGTGYSQGSINETNGGTYELAPVHLHIGYNADSLLGLEDSDKSLQFAIEPTFNQLVSPNNGLEASLGFFLKYLHPIDPKLILYTEIGTGPLYLSIDTFEQGHRGFNMLNQLGLGVQYKLTESKAISFSYRLRHISHANTRNSRNAGIDSDAFFVTFSQLF